MRKNVLILLAVILFASCGPSRVEREAERTFKGNWTLSSVNFPEGSQNLSVTIFQDATAECLRNSDWNFISNNNTGSYAITRPNCDNSSRYFIWSIDEVNADAGSYDLLLKPTDSDYKSVSGNQGFRLNLVNLTDATMVWEQTLNFEGKPFTIRMNFNKN